MRHPTRARWARRLSVQLLILCASINTCAEALQVFAEANPPFVMEGPGGKLYGPYAEAFNHMASAHGLQVSFSAMPARRAAVLMQRTPDSCMLAVNYSAANAEVMLYLGRITPVYVWAYARKVDGLRARSLSDLREHSVGLQEIAEIRQLLDAEGLQYALLPQSARGNQMLQAKRFDVLISDFGAELAASNEGLALDRLFTVARIDRWLACNPGTQPPVLAKLRAALREGLFASDVHDVWDRYGMSSYYARVRKEWLTTSQR